MRLRVQHELVPLQCLGIVLEKQIEILERLAQKERLHQIFGAHVRCAADVSYRRVAVRHLGEVLEALEYPPAPVLVCGVFGVAVHVPETLYELGAEQVVGVVCFYVHVVRVFTLDFLSKIDDVFDYQISLETNLKCVL